MTTVAVLGLGEAGALYARGLRDAGFAVSGFDPFALLDEPGIARHDRLDGAVRPARLVLSVVGAQAAPAVAAQALPLLADGAVYADLNTASPSAKRAMAEIPSSALFADVAVLAPVPRAGVRTPLLVSGPGADAFRRLLAPAGAPVESIGGAAGDAAGRKLLRSVFMKGLAAVVLEAVSAADRAGQGDWLRAQIDAELSGRPGDLVERLLSGSRRHAARRVRETADASAYLRELGTPHRTTDAAHAWLASLADPPPATEGRP